MSNTQYKIVHRFVLLSTHDVPGLVQGSVSRSLLAPAPPQNGKPSSPRVLALFPEPNGVQLPKHFEEFCYPDLDAYMQPHLEPLHHVFVLTEGDGKRLFGVCRRMWTFNGPPLCLVLLSYFPIFEPLIALLGFVSTHLSQASLESIFACLDSISLESNMEHVGSTSSLIPNTYIDIRYISGHFEIPGNINVSSVGEPPLQPLLSCLSADTILLIIALILTERRVIFSSKNVENLTLSILGLASLLAPFSWQFIFVPVLPQSLQAYCSAPMPFLIGIHSSILSAVRRLPLEEVVFVDLDAGECECEAETYSHLLPPHLTAKAHSALSRAGMRIGESLLDAERAIRSEFTLMFVALFGNYLWFVRPNNNDAQAPQMLPSGVKASQGTTNASLSASGNVVASHVTEDFVFEKEYFLRSVSDFDTRELLKVLIQSQMFDEFLMERYRALKENRVINSVFDHEAHRMRSNGPPPTVDADLSLTSTVSYMKSLGRSWTKNIKVSLGDWQQKMNKWEFRSEWAPNIYKSVASAVGKGPSKPHFASDGGLEKGSREPLKAANDPILGPFSDHDEPYSDDTPPVPEKLSRSAPKAVFSNSNRPVVLPRMEINASTPQTARTKADMDVVRIAPPPPQRHRSKEIRIASNPGNSPAPSTAGSTQAGSTDGKKGGRKNPFATPPLAHVSHTLIDLPPPTIPVHANSKANTSWSPFGNESPQRKGSVSAKAATPASPPPPVSLLDEDLNDPFLAISQRSKPT